MKKKKIIIITAFVLLIIVAFVVILMTRKKPSEIVEVPETFPAEDLTVDYDEEEFQSQLPDFKEERFLEDVDIPEDDIIEISGVSMPNFYKFGTKPGFLGETIIISDPSFQIIYYPLDEGFLIPILNHPFNEYRVLAEEDFVKALKISKQDACKLKVGITTPFSYNPYEAGINWPLSWCE